ncbi:MAG: endonuclease III [Bacteriovoracaceae bacterium]|nr:endonuclease III [Bacteriovoracaceae bacterium]
MNKKLKDNSTYISDTLLKLFPTTGIPLNHENGFTLLVAVLLSAQCTDKRVNQITPALFAKAKSAKEMLKLSVEEIDAIVRPCGLAPRKAAAIRGLSEILVAKWGGEVPQSWEALEELPGVGHKTASVVMAQWFGEPAFPIDTHIQRLSQVWGLTKSHKVEQIEKDLKSLFPKDIWNELHLRIIFFGREYCPANKCDGKQCSLCQELFPKRRPGKYYSK